MTQPWGPLKIELPWPPTTNHRLTSLVVNGHARGVLSKDARQYKKDARDALVPQLLASGIGYLLPTADLVGLRYRFYFPRRLADLSNRVKIPEDAMTGMVYVDDSQVREFACFYEYDPKRPRVEIVVWPILA